MKPSDVQTAGGPKGIGGWLYVVAFGLSVTLILSFIETHASIQLLFQPYDQSIPGLTAILYFEALAQVMALFFLIYVLMLMQKKDKAFPAYYIFFFIFLMLVNFVDGAAIYMLDFPTEAIRTAYIDSAQNVMLGNIQLLAILLIWGTYMKVSKRVRNTFIN